MCKESIAPMPDFADSLPGMTKNRFQIVTEERAPKVALVEAVLNGLLVEQRLGRDFMANEGAAEEDSARIIENEADKLLNRGRTFVGGDQNSAVQKGASRHAPLSQSPAFGDLAFQLSPVQQLAARGDVFLAKLPEFLAQRCDRRLRSVAVLLANRLIVVPRHTFILTRNGLR